MIDDGSSDHTGELLERLAARHPRLKILRHPSTLGAGACLRTGLAAAKHPLFFYSTCDQQYQPADLRRLLEVIDKVHVVSGYRKWQAPPCQVAWLGRIYRGLVRIVFGYPLEPLPGWLGWRDHLHSWLARAFFGVRFHDVNCLFRLFRRRHLQPDSDPVRRVFCSCRDSGEGELSRLLHERRSTH